MRSLICLQTASTPYRLGELRLGFKRKWLHSIGTMTDLNRGIMKFDGADSPAAIILSAIVILGGIALLVLWAMNGAYQG